MISVPVASSEKEGALNGRVQIPPFVKTNRQKKPTMNGQFRKSYRLGRRPDEQGLRSLSWDQDRVEKLATGTTVSSETTTANHMSATTQRTSTAPTLTPTQRISAPTTIYKQISNKLKVAKDVFTIDTWNARTLWATDKLKLLRNEMKRYQYDIIGISEVCWTGKAGTRR